MLNFGCIQCPHRDWGTCLLQVMQMVKGFAELELQPLASTYSAAKNSCPFRHWQSRGSLSGWMSGPGPPPHVVPCQHCLLQGRLLSSWMRVCRFSLRRVTDQTKCRVPLGHVPSFPGTVPTLPLIPDLPRGKGKWQLTAIDGWGLPLHLSTDKCFNLSALRNHIDWRDFVLFLGSANRKGKSSFNIFLPWAWFYCTSSEKAFLFKAQGKLCL